MAQQGLERLACRREADPAAFLARAERIRAAPRPHALAAGSLTVRGSTLSSTNGSAGLARLSPGAVAGPPFAGPPPRSSGRSPLRALGPLTVRYADPSSRVGRHPGGCAGSAAFARGCCAAVFLRLKLGAGPRRPSGLRRRPRLRARRVARRGDPDGAPARLRGRARGRRSALPDRRRLHTRRAPPRRAEARRGAGVPGHAAVCPRRNVRRHQRPRARQPRPRAPRPRGPPRLPEHALRLPALHPGSAGGTPMASTRAPQRRPRSPRACRSSCASRPIRRRATRPRRPAASSSCSARTAPAPTSAARTTGATRPRRRA